MKRVFAILLVLVLIIALSVPAIAAVEPTITLQPQNPTYSKYSVAEYFVKVKGENLQCTWYMEYEGKTYNISDTSGGMQPWEAYAGETYGAKKDVNGKYTTFSYFFGGIETELDGSVLYAVIEDGHYDIKSAKAYITVVNDCAEPPKTIVAPEMEIYKGESLDLYCEVKDSEGNLSYIWYETSSGSLRDITAIDRGAETSDTLKCDTSETGTRYYVCRVETSEGGSAYTSVIPVTVVEKPSSDRTTADTDDNDDSDVTDEPEDGDDDKGFPVGAVLGGAAVAAAGGGTVFYFKKKK
ncbi:MAG: hypothetical protein IJP00_07355 [Firmicutes bacterium]|nr:hypothetical protein [Bacillota bacterium]